MLQFLHQSLAFHTLRISTRDKQPSSFLNRFFLGIPVLATVLFTPLSTPLVSALSFGVSPPRIELEIGAQNSTQAIRVFNVGDAPISIQVLVQSWTLDEQNELQIIEPTEQSLSEWLVINPLLFTIQPGETQTVRLAVRPRVEPEAGEHRALVYFDEIPDDSEDVGGIRVKGRLGVAIYGYVGPIERVGVLHDIDVDASGDGVEASFNIASQGTAHVRLSGQYAIWQATDYPGAENTARLSDDPEASEAEAIDVEVLDPDDPEIQTPPLLTEDVGEEENTSPWPSGVVQVGGLPILPVLPLTQRSLILSIPDHLPPGQYVFDVNGDISGSPVDVGIPFSVPE